jgi:hypothetical protein
MKFSIIIAAASLAGTVLAAPLAAPLSKEVNARAAVRYPLITYYNLVTDFPFRILNLSSLPKTYMTGFVVISNLSSLPKTYMTGFVVISNLSSLPKTYMTGYSLPMRVSDRRLVQVVMAAIFRLNGHLSR